MALIVVTNFLCWCPVIVMGMMSLAGFTIPGIVNNSVGFLHLQILLSIRCCVFLDSRLCISSELCDQPYYLQFSSISDISVHFQKQKKGFTDE